MLPPALLLEAYGHGFFPMGDPATGGVNWFRPNPRAILPLKRFHCSRSLSRSLRNGGWTVTFDCCFVEVMRGCADRQETWLTEEISVAHGRLFDLGFAHSVEIWKKGVLAGGLYGITLGGAFFAESKFHRQRDASKVALWHLVERLKQRHFSLLEVQFLTPHLERLGAVEVSARQYDALLKRALELKCNFG